VSRHLPSKCISTRQPRPFSRHIGHDHISAIETALLKNYDEHATQNCSISRNALIIVTFSNRVWTHHVATEQDWSIRPLGWNMQCWLMSQSSTLLCKQKTLVGSWTHYIDLSGNVCKTSSGFVFFGSVHPVVCHIRIYDIYSTDSLHNNISERTTK
jgi:hypothetical protein